MDQFRVAGRFAQLASCSAITLMMLSGCSGHSSLASARGPSVVGAVSEQHHHEGEIAGLEAQVAKAPRSSEARVSLAKAYLSAGRFDSAITTFQDAVTLGENSPSIGLGLALCYIGSGRNAEALNELARWRSEIPVADLGLAVALAGQPAQGVEILTSAVRGGDSSAKARQNLAYAYALDGRWSEARVIASQDVPADQIDARLSDWASRTRPEQFRARVAGLLGAPVTVDPGQPVALALGNRDDAVQFAEAAATASEPAPEAELAPLSSSMKVADAAVTDENEKQPAQIASMETYSVASASPAAETGEFLPKPVIRSVPVARSLASHIAAPVGGSHMLQLGSFSTLENAKRAQEIFKSRDPRLRGHTMRITEADVKGRRYYRVVFEGFDQNDAASLCSGIRQRGGACIAYAGDRLLPGALPSRAQSAAKLAKR
jgi:Flp pilus assembly protein TadD, contains TPR repeats